MLADIRVPQHSSIDMAASVIAAILGLSGVVTFYLGYTGFPTAALPAGSGLILAALVIGAQAYRRQKDRRTENTATPMQALADLLPNTVVIRNLKGEVVFAQAGARAAVAEQDLLAEAGLISVDDRNPAAEEQHAKPAYAGQEAREACAPVRLPWRDDKGKVMGWVEISTAAHPRSPVRETSSEVPLAALVTQRTAQIREVLAHTEASHEEKNKAIARKLHGDLGSTLTALSMHLAMLSKHLPSDTAAQERMHQIKALLNSAAETTRCIESELRPGKLELFGLKAAAEDLVQHLLGPAGVTCTLHFPDETLSYPASLQITLYRMLEEVLGNVGRQADATQVDITLEEAEDWIKLSIEDNGVPCSLADMPAESLGLRRMKERAAYLGGSVLMRSGPRQGNIIEITLPRMQVPQPA